MYGCTVPVWGVVIYLPRFVGEVTFKPTRSDYQGSPRLKNYPVFVFSTATVVDKMVLAAWYVTSWADAAFFRTKYLSTTFGLLFRDLGLC